ncbi:hypothetical protein Tco_0991323 [Tanacetum coccineum]|uniref:Uncharacterized protein n=1 Tax=Tanacetum coccineum TaxID=301880 RepID=A0ABQ5F005_9ASTR
MDGGSLSSVLCKLGVKGYPFCHKVGCLPWLEAILVMPDLWVLMDNSEGNVMDAPTIPFFADSSKGNFRDAIDIGVDVVHQVPVATVAFPVVTIVTMLSRHREAIRGIHVHLQGVPIEEEMSTLRFRMGMAKPGNASLRGKIRTMGVIETVTRSQERRAHMEMER